MLPKNGRPMEQVFHFPSGHLAIVIRDFIGADERILLAEWADKMLPFLKPNRRGPERLYRQVQDLPMVPEVYTSVRERLQLRFGLSASDREPEFGWFLGSIGDGGFIHQHTDPVREGTRHLRCNLFVQLPESGGEPVVEDTVQHVNEGSILCFFPDAQRHCCNIVRGSRRRVVCSFGYLVAPDYSLL
jgi:hypothetical protein